MTPYRIHLDNWTVALYSTDDGRLTFTVTNHEESSNRLMQLRGEVRLQRLYLGSMCAGDLAPSPFPSLTKDQLLAKQGSG